MEHYLRGTNNPCPRRNPITDVQQKHGEKLEGADQDQGKHPVRERECLFVSVGIEDEINEVHIEEQAKGEFGVVQATKQY
mmetsp:Transcript_29440/g.57635  ORF Transcript_29440/g.57635 Transcript_29440/m.57635 type:complete len:80 (+) Transcript_29440:1638-1877(+)